MSAETLMMKIFSIAFISIFIIVIASFIYTNLIKGKDYKGKSKRKLAKDNEFVLKNKDKIEQVMDANSEELKSLRKKALLSVILFAISLVLMIIPFIVPSLTFTLLSFISPLLFVVAIIVMGIHLGKYYNLNEEKYVDVVKNTIHEYDSDLEYKPTGIFSKSEYHTCLFPETCDRLDSEDTIINSKKHFCYSDITSMSRHKDDDGDIYYATEFQGSLARMNIKNVNCRIFLGSTSGNLIFGSDSYKKIKFENDEFNKLFKACTDSELLAYELLTPDIMEEFVNIKKNTYGDIDIRIIYDKLYIRFLSGNTFDSKLFNKKSEKSSLLQSIAVLEEVIKAMDKTKKIIDKKDLE